MMMMDVACATYEVDFIEERSIKYSREPVWLLGCCYNPQDDYDKLLEDVNSRFWFTYRRNYPPIGGTGPTYDKGWGCMLRCGQMVLGQALVMRHLGRDWRWNTAGQGSPNYWKILKLFLDSKEKLYSIHQIAQMGVSEGKKVGQWFGPNTAAQVIRKLCSFDEWSRLGVHVAMDNTVIVDDIKITCTENRATATEENNAVENSNDSTDQHRQQNTSSAEDTLADNAWKPMVLFIPLRLGLNEFNPIYKESLKNCFKIRRTLGIIGGKPNSAHYFIGVQGDYLLYLDPHTVQEAIKNKTDATFPDKTYHQKYPNRLHIAHMDPSIAVGFYCDTEAEFNELCQDLRELNSYHPPLFEIIEHRPKHWPPLVLPNSLAEDADTSEIGFTEIHKDDRQYDSEEDFEIIDM